MLLVIIIKNLNTQKFIQKKKKFDCFQTTVYKNNTL